MNDPPIDLNLGYRFIEEKNVSNDVSGETIKITDNLVEYTEPKMGDKISNEINTYVTEKTFLVKRKELEEVIRKAKMMLPEFLEIPNI